jgi:uncharacterized lipoprotein YbaY
LIRTVPITVLPLTGAVIATSVAEAFVNPTSSSISSPQRKTTIELTKPRPFASRIKIALPRRAQVRFPRAVSGRLRQKR